MTKLQKEDLFGLYPISCTEAYVMAYLYKVGYDITTFYYSSFISINHIVSDFLKCKNSFSLYEGMERVQDVAKALNVLNYCGKITEKFRNIEFSCDMVLIEVTKEYYNKIYNRNLWREDHFVYVYPLNDSNFFYLNNNPLHEANFCVDLLEEMYNKHYIKFWVDENSKFIELEDILKKLKDRVNNEMNFSTVNNLVDVDFSLARDIINYIRISWLRINSLLKKYGHFEKKYIDDINRVFTQIEYSRIRNRYNSKIFCEGIEMLKKDQDEIVRYLLDL